MHEYHTTERLLAVALEQANLQPGERITRLQINLDPDSGYAPASIQFYFEQLAVGTPAAQAELRFETNSATQPVQLVAVEIADPVIVSSNVG